MIKLLLEQYAKTKLIELPKEFSAPKLLKLEEIGVPLSKINENNFYELCDIEYQDILEDRLYLFPETKINFIIEINKAFNPIEKIKNLTEWGIYEMPPFVANGYRRDEVENAGYMNLAKQANVVNFSEKDLRLEMSDKSFAGLEKTIGLMIDCIKEEIPENAKFVHVNNKLGKDKLLDLLDRCPKGFLPIYDLGFNIIVER
jgi:hypothetical protein